MVRNWLLDPIVGRMVAVAVTLAIVFAAVRAAVDVSILRPTLMKLENGSPPISRPGLVRSANSFVFKNCSADCPFLWDEISHPVKYGSGWKLARQMLQNIVDEVLVRGYRSGDRPPAWQLAPGLHARRPRPCRHDDRRMARRA